MTPADVQFAATQLDGVASTGVAVPIFTARWPGMGIHDGYAIQRAWSDLRRANGDALVGYKVGLTSRAMQMQLKVDASQYGRLHESHRIADGSRISASRFLKPRVEIELAFVLESVLKGPAASAADVIAATDFVQPALEIVDYRTEVPRQVPDMIADNTAAAGFVLGVEKVSPSAVDLNWIAAVASKNDVVEETGVAAGILGDPAQSLAILVNGLAREGLHLRPGDIVLAGSMTRQIEVAAGDRLVADYGKLGKLQLEWI